MNEVIKTILERRAVRKYENRPVSREDLETLVKCGQYAASGLLGKPGGLRGGPAGGQQHLHSGLLCLGNGLFGRLRHPAHRVQQCPIQVQGD